MRLFPHLFLLSPFPSFFRPIVLLSVRLSSAPILSQVCIVFTDGQATDEKEVPAASKAWREEGIKVFAVGIGDGIDMQGDQIRSKIDNCLLIVIASAKNVDRLKLKDR